MRRPRIIIALSILLFLALVLVGVHLVRKDILERRTAGAMKTDVRVGQTTRQHVANFRSSDWETVFRAKWQLESLQHESIPALLSLLDTNEIVVLTDTADLIYPGAKTFYGHGWIVDYDLDYMPARAGWAIEEITFEDFGFSEGRIQEEALLDNAIHGKRDVAMGEVLPVRHEDSARLARVRDAVSGANAWWANQGPTWTRYKGLQDALRSGNPIRQVRALEWMRNGTTRCDGLDPDTYRKDLLSTVEELAHSGNEDVRIQARYLLDDDEGWWWKYKTDPDLRKWEDPSASDAQREAGHPSR